MLLLLVAEVGGLLKSQGAAVCSLFMTDISPVYSVRHILNRCHMTWSETFILKGPSSPVKIKRWSWYFIVLLAALLETLFQIYVTNKDTFLFDLNLFVRRDRDYCCWSIVETHFKNGIWVEKRDKSWSEQRTGLSYLMTCSSTHQFSALMDDICWRKFAPHTVWL